jgi:hypothetical protein
VDDFEDIIGGHVCIGSICILGGIWHILTKPFAWALLGNKKEDISFHLGKSRLFLIEKACYRSAYAGNSIIIYIFITKPISLKKMVYQH